LMYKHSFVKFCQEGYFRVFIAYNAMKTDLDGNQV
jgi:hypothetical protein